MNKSAQDLLVCLDNNCQYNKLFPSNDLQRHQKYNHATIPYEDLLEKIKNSKKIENLILKGMEINIDLNKLEEFVFDQETKIKHVMNQFIEKLLNDYQSLRGQIKIENQYSIKLQETVKLFYEQNIEKLNKNQQNFDYLLDVLNEKQRVENSEQLKNKMLEWGEKRVEEEQKLIKKIQEMFQLRDEDSEDEDDKQSNLFQFPKQEATLESMSLIKLIEQLSYKEDLTHLHIDLNPEFPQKKNEKINDEAIFVLSQQVAKHTRSLEVFSLNIQQTCFHNIE